MEGEFKGEMDARVRGEGEVVTEVGKERLHPDQETHLRGQVEGQMRAEVHGEFRMEFSGTLKGEMDGQIEPF
jgi:hypothetical protein